VADFELLEDHLASGVALADVLRDWSAAGSPSSLRDFVLRNMGLAARPNRHLKKKWDDLLQWIHPRIDALLGAPSGGTQSN
jgi:hypothetical protein